MSKNISMHQYFDIDSHLKQPGPQAPWWQPVQLPDDCSQEADTHFTEQAGEKTQKHNNKLHNYCIYSCHCQNSKQYPW